MQERTLLFTDGEVEMNYKIFTPSGTDFPESLPLIVFLHGAGERGKNAEHLVRHGIPKLIREGREYPAVILCPQCPATCVWDNVVFPLKRLIDRVAAEYRADLTRVTLTGASMGGFGTWMTGMTFGGHFAGIAPVAGGGFSWRAANLVSTPVFAVHGEADTDVPIVYSRLMVDGVTKAGGAATLLPLPGMGHNDGIDYAYRETDLIPWLLSQKRTDFTPPKEVCSNWF